MITPTPNDVLSGRGHSVNNHPGNEAFRRMLELHMVRATTESLPSSLQIMMNFAPLPCLFNHSIYNLLCPLLFIITKVAYSAGTKKQKMMISRTIVDDIYSKEPPGRFLKECPDTGQWIELSRREAADKAAQAMAYTVRNANSPKSASKKKRKAPSSPSTTTAATTATSKQQEGTVKDQSLPSHANVGHRGGSVAAMSASSAITASTNNPPPPSISSLQQQIFSLPLQQSSTSLPAISSVTSELLAQLMLVTQQQQQQIQQQIQQQQLVLSHLLASLTAPAPAPPISAPPPSLVSAPTISSSTQEGASFTLPNTSNINNDILRQICFAAQQGNIGTGLQPASLTPQHQAILQLANPSNQSSIFGAATNSNPLAAAHEQHELDLVYRASMVQNQFNQPLLMSSPPNSLSTALSFQQQPQQSQPLRQNHASASIRSYPPHPPQAAKNDEEII